MEESTEFSELVNAAAQHDSEAGLGQQPEDASQNEAESVVNAEADASKAETKASDDAGAKEDSSLKDSDPKKSDDNKQKPETKKQESKFAQENVRKTRTWEQINSEKAALKAERDALAKEREEWQKSRQTAEITSLDTFRDDKNLTAKDYEEAAKSFEADGDFEKAKLARAKASDVRSKASEHFQKVEAEKFSTTWKSNFDYLAEKEPWLKDDNHPSNKATVELIKQYPMLQRDPNGLVHAVNIIKLQEKAATVDQVSKENESLKERLAKLEKKTSIGKGTPTQQLKSKETDINKMSSEEQFRHLQAAAAEFDSQNNR